MANPLNTAGKVATPKKYPAIPTSSPVPSPSLINNQANNPGIPKDTPVPSPRNTAPKMAIPKDSGTVPPYMDTSKFNKPSIGMPIPKNAPVPAPPPKEINYSNPEYADWYAKQNEMFANLEKMVNTPFNYDPNTDAALQSQRVLYEQGAKTASDNALSTMNDRGIMNSSLTGNQLGQIEQNANTQFNALIPQYQQQAYGQYQDKLANAGKLLANSMELRNNQFNERMTKAEIMGTDLPDGAEQLVNQLLSLKGINETKGISAEQKSINSSQADQLRAQLQVMGVDISKLGANTSLANSSVGQRTLAGQQLDYTKQADQRNFDYQQERDVAADQQWQDQFGVTLAQVTGYMPDGTPTSAQQQQDLNNLWMVADQTGTIPASLAQIYGLKAGTPTRSAKEFAAQLAIQQQNANSSSTSAAASMMNAKTNQQQENRMASSSSSGGGTSSKDPKYNYKNDPVFFKAMQTVNNIANPQQALNELQDRAEEFYDTFGYEAYNTLLKTTQDRIDKQAKAAEKLNPYSQFGNF